MLLLDIDDTTKALLRQQWEANKDVTGGHEWAPPEWAEIEQDGIPLPPFKWDEEQRAACRLTPVFFIKHFFLKNVKGFNFGMVSNYFLEPNKLLWH